MLVLLVNVLITPTIYLFNVIIFFLYLKIRHFWFFFLKIIYKTCSGPGAGGAMPLPNSLTLMLIPLITNLPLSLTQNSLKKLSHESLSALGLGLWRRGCWFRGDTLGLRLV